jgi:DNA repair protein RadC
MGDNENLSLAGISLSKLKSIKGVGRVKAITLKAAFELASRVNLNTEDRLCINSVSTLGNFVADRLSNEKQENILVIGLDSKSRLVKSHIVAIGKLNEAAIENREIFRIALECGCAYIAIGHNHPSGDPTPSYEDVVMTRNLIELGRLLRLPLIDHIVLGKGKFVSMRKDGEDIMWFNFAENIKKLKDFYFISDLVKMIKYHPEVVFTDYNIIDRYTAQNDIYDLFDGKRVDDNFAELVK